MAAVKRKPGVAVRGAALAMPPFDPRRETVDDFELRVRQHLTQHPAAQLGNGAVAEKRHRNLLLQHLPPPVKAALEAALRPRNPSLAPVPALLAALRVVRTECLAEASRGRPASAPACKAGSTPHAKARLRLQRLLQPAGCSVARFVQQLDQLMPQCGYAEDIGEAVAKDRLVVGLLERGMRCRLLEMLDRGASYQQLRAFALQLEQTGDLRLPLPECGPAGTPGGNPMGHHGGCDSRNGMGDDVGHRMGNRMGPPVDSHIMRNMENMENSMRPPMENRMRPLSEAPIENSMGNRMRPLLEYPVENYREPPMGNRMRPLWENPMENPGPNMRHPMGEPRGPHENHMGNGKAMRPGMGQHALQRGAGVLREQVQNQNAAWERRGDGFADDICLDGGDGDGFRQFDGDRGGAWGGRSDGGRGDDWEQQDGAGWGDHREEGRDHGDQYRYQDAGAEECARCGLVDVGAGSRCPRCSEQWARGPATGNGW